MKTNRTKNNHHHYHQAATEFLDKKFHLKQTKPNNYMCMAATTKLPEQPSEKKTKKINCQH